MATQGSFLNIDDYREYKSRGKYNTKPKEVLPIDPWSQMAALYQRLGRFVPMPLFQREDIEIDQGIIKGWYYVYTNNGFSYEGENYRGGNFQVFEAEIKGTENWGLEDRIEIHKRFIEYLEEGYSQDKAEELIKAEYKI